MQNLLKTLTDTGMFFSLSALRRSGERVGVRCIFFWNLNCLK